MAGKKEKRRRTRKENNNMRRPCPCVNGAGTEPRRKIKVKFGRPCFSYYGGGSSRPQENRQEDCHEETIAQEDRQACSSNNVAVIGAAARKKKDNIAVTIMARESNSCPHRVWPCITIDRLIDHSPSTTSFPHAHMPHHHFVTPRQSRELLYIHVT